MSNSGSTAPPPPPDGTIVAPRLIVSADDLLLKALGSTPESRWSVAATLQLAQVVAIIAGGLWAYHLYATFQRENNLLILKASQAHLKQAEADLEQIKLSIQKT